MPLTSGENACTSWEFRAMFEAGAVDYAQPSVTKVGGVTEFLGVVDLARDHGVALAPHSPFFGPGFIASLHLVAALAPGASVEHSRRILDASFYGSAFVARGGKVTVPQGPGLGIDPDPDVIRICRLDA